MTLLRLITGPFGAPRCNSNVNEHNGNVLEERRSDEEDLIDTVLEIVFRVMWKGVEGFGESDWRVKLGPVHTYPDIFESATFSFRIQNFPRQHVAYSNRIRLSTRI